VEDCAQSYLCTRGKRIAGTMGDAGCWSINESKHIGAGDGGMMLTNNRTLARRADLFADKCYNREGGGHDPFFAPMTYRLNALAAAVAIEQFKRLDKVVARRNLLGSRLDAELAAIEGVKTRPVRRGDYATYWFHLFRIDPGLFGVTNEQFAEALRAEGIPAHVPHTLNVLYWSLFRKDNDDRHACSYHCPLYKEPKPDYDVSGYSGVQQACREGIELLISPNFSIRDVTDMARAITKLARFFGSHKS